MMQDDAFADALEGAKNLGYDNRERLIARLHLAVTTKANYLEYRKRRNRTGSHNVVEAEEAAAIAMAIQMLSETTP